MSKTVGVLGLQGDFALHEKSLKKTGVKTRIVRTPGELEGCDGLILPGGESTTIVKLMKKAGLFEAVRDFAKGHAVMGTCAGLIVSATDLKDPSLDTLGLIDLSVERNAYGRQVDSFTDGVTVDILNGKPMFEGVFIRAPKILSVGKETEILGRHGEEIVMARNERVLVMTFHPELTPDARIHRYFVDEVLNAD